MPDRYCDDCGEFASCRECEHCRLHFCAACVEPCDGCAVIYGAAPAPEGGDR